MRGFSSRTAQAGRLILLAVEDVQNLFLPGGAVLDASVNWHQGGRVALAGTPVYRHTNGLYRPYKGATAVGAGADDTELVLDDASLYAVGDAIYVGAAKTVADIDYDTNTITLNAAATWSDGAAIGPSSGYRTATNVSGLVYDEFGVNLDNADGDAEDAVATLLIRGRVKSDMVIGGASLFASILAGEQPFVNDLQFWDGDQRVA